MADPSESSEASPEPGSDDGDVGATDDGPEDHDVVGSVGAGATESADPEPSRDPETIREKVEGDYDFEQFSPADMVEMTAEEWEVAFDPDSWIVGPELLDRVEADLRSRVAHREVFAVVERTEVDGEEHVLAYTDVGYALVAPDGSVEGEGSILEDVEPVVALCSMEDYDVPEPPADAGLPHPGEVADGAGSIGDRLLLAVAGVQILAGLVLLVSPLFLDVGPAGPGSGSGLLTTVAGLAFLFIGVVIGVLVANARLSGRFRAEEYRQRLEAAGVGSEFRPTFLPGEGGGDDREGDDGDGEGGAGVGADRTDGTTSDATGDGGDERSGTAPD